MMALEGMDVERAALIARQLDGYEQELRNIVGAIAWLTTELSYRWRGAASAMFEQQSPRYQEMIAVAANAIADMRARLNANIAQQEQASAAAGGGGASATGAGAAISGAALTMLLSGRPAAALDLADRADKFVLKPLDTVHDLATGDSRILRSIKGGPAVLRSLADNPFVQSTDNLLRDARVTDALPVLGKAGIVFGVVSAGTDLFKAYNYSKHGNDGAAANEVVSAVADGLMATPDPVTIGAGLAIKGIQFGFDSGAFQKAFDFMAQSRWTQGLYNPAYFIGHDYFPAVKSVSSDLASTFTRIF